MIPRPANPLIVALDLPDLDRAESLAASLAGGVGHAWGKLRRTGDVRFRDALIVGAGSIATAARRSDSDAGVSVV
mgnify:CR=1 FL=1